MKYLIEIIGGKKKKKESNNTSRTDICQNKQLGTRAIIEPAKETDNKRPKMMKTMWKLGEVSFSYFL